MKEVMATNIIGTKEALKRLQSNSVYGLGYCENDALVTEELLRKQFMEEKEMGFEKIVTLIGSMSEVNKAAMMALYNRLTLKGDFVYLPYMDRVPEDVSDEQIETLHNLHEYKMGKADLVIVINVDGHVGKDTQREINWCNDHNKNIIYLSDMLACDFLRPNCCDNIRPSDMRTKGGKK
jgi:hypothetical protein